MSSRPFDVCWERVARADTHRKAMVSAWKSFADRNPYDFRIEVDPDGAGRLVMERFVTVPTILALELGEFLYQMRAALDACVYETACINTGESPPPNENTLEFPICVNRAAFDKSSWKIKPLTDEQGAIVESVQPYNTPEDLADELLPLNFNRALGILNDWARKDRHRKLHVVAAWASNVKPMLRWRDKRIRVTGFTVAHQAFLLHDESVVATFIVEAQAGRDLKIEGNPNLTLDIALDEVPLPCHHRDNLTNRLECIKLAVGSIIHGMGVTVGVDRTE